MCVYKGMRGCVCVCMCACACTHAHYMCEVVILWLSSKLVWHMYICTHTYAHTYNSSPTQNMCMCTCTGTHTHVRTSTHVKEVTEDWTPFNIAQFATVHYRPETCFLWAVVHRFILLSNNTLFSKSDYTPQNSDLGALTIFFYIAVFPLVLKLSGPSLGLNAWIN